MTETIDSANAATSTLFLGQNGEWWDFWLIVSLVLVALAAIAAGITTTGSIVSHKREATASEEALKLYKLETNKGIALATARQKEAELKLAQMRQLSGPRSIDIDAFLKQLEGKPKAPVVIWYLPDSSDGYWFASRLQGALGTAKWPVDWPIAIPDLDEKVVEAVVPSPGILLSILHGRPRAVNAGGQPSGVTVVSDGMDGEDSPNGDTPYSALFNALAKSTNFGMYGSGGSQFMPVPKGTLRVVIAAKSDPMFVDPPPNTEPK